MRLNQFDLNLLVALDALLTEQNTTRAGHRLAPSQSTMSASLAKLRRHFRDEILMPVGRQMIPTPLGLHLRQAVRELLLLATTTLQSSPRFDAAVSERRFRLMMSDYVSTVLMAPTTARLQRLAPRISIELVPHVDVPWESLDHGEVDLLIMPTEFLAPDHPHQTLFEDHYVCVAWAGNPLLGRRLTLEAWKRMPHVIAQIGVQRRREISHDERALHALGLTRHIDVVLSEFGAIAHYLLGTTRIATMHRRLALTYAQMLPLRILPLPLKSPTITEAMQWHRHRERDLGIEWLRAQLSATAAQIGAAPRRRARPARRSGTGPRRAKSR